MYKNTESGSVSKKILILLLICLVVYIFLYYEQFVKSNNYNNKKSPQTVTLLRQEKSSDVLEAILNTNSPDEKQLMFLGFLCILLPTILHIEKKKTPDHKETITELYDDGDDEEYEEEV